MISKSSRTALLLIIGLLVPAASASADALLEQVRRD
jgi:hypothetical protein